MAVESLHIPDWTITKSEDTSIGSRDLNMYVCTFTYTYYYLKLLDSVNLSLVTMTQCYTSLIPRPPRPAFVACSMKCGEKAGRPGRSRHLICAAIRKRMIIYERCSFTNVIAAA